MKDDLKRLAICIERGKIDRNSPYPPDMKGQDGAAELAEKLLKYGISPSEILRESLMAGMSNIGDRFGRGEAFIPELLISARAMKAAMSYLKPHFETGEAVYKGTLVTGTVFGDLHDIGKNIVGMVVEGDGWKVVDLGSNVHAVKFVEAVREYYGAAIGISALLTTTMMNMEATVKMVKEEIPGTPVFVGGAPLTIEFSDKIGADGYFPDPHSFVKHLRTIASNHA